MSPIGAIARCNYLHATVGIYVLGWGGASLLVVLPELYFVGVEPGGCIGDTYQSGKVGSCIDTVIKKNPIN